MLPSYLRHMRYESRSRRQQRPCQSLPPEYLRSWTRVQLRRHAGGKDLRCFLGVCCCRRPYVLICWSYIAGSCCFSPLLFCVRQINIYSRNRSHFFIFTCHLFHRSSPLVTLTSPAAKSEEKRMYSQCSCAGG